MAEFLVKEGEERRNVSVLYAVETEEGYEADFVFENPRDNGKYVVVTYDKEAMEYRFELKEE